MNAHTENTSARVNSSAAANFTWKFAQLRAVLNRDRAYAVALLDAIYAKAVTDEAYLEHVCYWLDHGSTVALRDEVAAPFTDADFIAALAETHFYPFHDCWMAIDSASLRLREPSGHVFWIIKHVDGEAVTWEFWDGTYSTIYDEGIYDSLEAGMIAHAPAVFHLIDAPLHSGTTLY
jgi:hypothetical protein